MGLEIKTMRKLAGPETWASDDERHPSLMVEFSTDNGHPTYSVIFDPTDLDTYGYIAEANSKAGICEAIDRLIEEFEAVKETLENLHHQVPKFRIPDRFLPDSGYNGVSANIFANQLYAREGIESSADLAIEIGKEMFDHQKEWNNGNTQ